MKSLRQAFGEALLQLADKHNFVVLDADVAGGTGVAMFRDAYPERFFQFGIAEQNMMAAAAGMASEGVIPIVATFAVFAMRAWEMARLSIGYAQANVKIVASHPGLDAGEDGASAQCAEDLACFRTIPRMVVLSPASHGQVLKATREMLKMKGPVYMRTGRSPQPPVPMADRRKIVLGKGQVLREGSDITIIATGVQVWRSMRAAKLLERQGVEAAVINIHTIKPLDVELLEEQAKTTGKFIVTEDHIARGGLCGAVAEAMAQRYPVKMRFLALRDWGRSGDTNTLAKIYHMHPEAIAMEAAQMVRERH